MMLVLPCVCMAITSLVDTYFVILNITSAGQAAYPFSFWIARRNGSTIPYANAVC